MSITKIYILLRRGPVKAGTRRSPKRTPTFRDTVSLSKAATFRFLLDRKPPFFFRLGGRPGRAFKFLKQNISNRTGYITLSSS